MKICAAIFVIISFVIQCAIGETEKQTYGLVDVYAQMNDHNCEQMNDVIVTPVGFQTEEVMRAFSIAPEECPNLHTNADGFVYETDIGLAISDSLYMVDHDNLDQLRTFDLSFMPIEGACDYVLSCFGKLGMSVDIEAAYAIDAIEYERLYSSHKEWINDMGRSKLEWTDDDLCYVIYLNQKYEDINVYPGLYWYEELVNNYPGTEIVVFLSQAGFEYISCGWTTAIVDSSQLTNIVDYETAILAFTGAYNDLLTLSPKRIIVYDIALRYLTFDDNSNRILRPFWVFYANTEDGERKDYILDAVSGEVFGL